MLCLGIESTAHTFGVGIVDDKGNILANEKSTYRPASGWGIIPVDAANHHKKSGSKVIENALEIAGISIKDIDIVSFSQGPGLAPCLKVGMEYARDLANKSRRIIGVNHCIAHIEIGRLLTESKDPVIVYVSGANTQILSFSSGRYRCFGETMDIGLGNALDKFGRNVGLGFPPGPKIEKLAKNGNWVDLPYVVKGMDLSFSGIVTECIRKYNAGYKLEDICFSMQEVFFSMLVEVTERALAHLGKKEVLLTGGVAANARLQEMLGIMCKERGAEFNTVPIEYAGDNGAMIAWTGILHYKSNKNAPCNENDIDIQPRQRTDMVEIGWIK
ncbi:MAG TPA: bifunctional N(6)-L-threonylcarbamoyladenine synthase/serine/threonine protein kinase [Candidatus Aenigmarchaeota archaeon]|nr:bifunctional N(6)-L-threonylcarbamoyladenine synthase/serine/threonine protein kinase [Candidatus Aenigmarchaeota archaeon]